MPNAEKLPLPPVLDPGEGPPHTVVCIEPSANGATLLLRRRGGMPYEQLVIDTHSGEVKWRLTDDSAGGGLAWRMLLSPDGATLAVWVNESPETPWRLLRDGHDPVDLPGFDGGAWTADGSWLGGPGGAFDLDGNPLEGTPPAAGRLFHHGPNPDMLSFVQDSLFAWDGLGPPIRLRPWHHEDVVAAHRIDHPLMHPMHFSPDGAYLAWADRHNPQLVRLCDNVRYKVVEFEGEVTDWAWTSRRWLWVLREGGVHRVDAHTGSSTQLDLPQEVRPTALGGATDAQQLFVGTEDGSLYRIFAEED